MSRSGGVRGEPLEDAMDLDDRAPSLADLSAIARRRVPRFVWEYLDSATGDETSKRGNTAALDAVRLVPRVLSPVEADLTTKVLGHDWALPVGMAPVGMSGLVWPGAESALAGAAHRAGIPYCLSTVASATPEEIGPLTGGRGWFQLYPPRDSGIRRDMLARARDSGFETLILTADVGTPSRRERQRRARLSNPMRLTPWIVAQAALCPAWSIATLRAGVPRLKTLEPYVRNAPGGTTGHIGYQLRVSPDRAYLEALRAEWDGPLVVKGVLHPADAQALDGVADAVWVSNHGGRQFEAAPAAATVLPAIRDALPDMPLIADGGVRSGTDVLRLIALGADMVMLGRAFHHGYAAFGQAGIDHAIHVLREGLIADMGQLAIASPAEAKARL
ncbi:L-lactate dehydrogenase (cytochrome) [Palleronia marisminoris]|uniref:L-lactate dehydrogenase [cytochrome] n=1 Tax=Palleronia marisminoris TaxID=315423 RepID=A0A1Y5RRT1_9RHOB|nr:alpha-hydroxy acid oxidase [Palleronia marisminoris]SFG53461.1 L-lactate dehydrogenase (cytochrome) [Palleronia marisminoris]SLN23466.1 L-lactate dehydrogenase [cytochrome] [Palleronia marisminoris]